MKRVSAFAEWVLNVGNGEVTPVRMSDSVNGCLIKIPDEFCILSENSSVDQLIDIVYPNIYSNFSNLDYLRARSNTNK